MYLDHPSLTDEEIISVWHRRRDISQQLRFPYEQQWIANWKAYRAYLEEVIDPSDWWRSNTYIPELFNSVETILPRMILGMFSSPEWFDVVCPHVNGPGHIGAPCVDYERIVKSLLLYGTRRMNLFEPAYEGSKYGTIMGHTWWKLNWERSYTNRAVDVPVTDPLTGEVLGMSSKVMPTVDYDDPRLSWVSNFRLWPDPTGQGEYFIEVIDTTLEKLKRINDNLGIYKNLDKLWMAPIEYAKQRNAPVGLATWADRQAELDALEGFSRTVRDEGHEGTPVRLEVCTGLVPYDPDDGIYWRRTVIANDNFIIRDTANPTPDLKPEYFGSQQIPIPGFVYGDSVVRYGRPLNDAMNRIENYRMDEVVLGVWQQYIANRNAVQSSQLQFGPGGVIFVDTAADVRTAFATLDRRPVNPEAYRESDQKRSQIERVTGATAINQGVAADRETATSVGARVQLGSERFRLAVMWQNMTFKRQLLKRMFALYQRNMPPDRLIRLVGTDYKVPVDISMLQDEIDINIDADVYEVDGPAKQQAMAFFLQSAANPAFAQWWRTDELLRDAVEAYLNKDGRRYVKSQEEMAAEAQAQIFAAVAASSAMGGPGPTPSIGGGASKGGGPRLLGALAGGAAPGSPFS